jgi:hypothetical protein
MKTTATIRVSFNTPLAKAMGESFTTEVAAEFGDQVLARAKENTAPGKGPGPHPHVSEHFDTGTLMENIFADIAKTANGVTMHVWTPIEYGLWNEAGWTTTTGRFIRYPWLSVAVSEVQKELSSIIRAKADVAFAGGARGGAIAIRKGSNTWDYLRGSSRK